LTTISNQIESNVSRVVCEILEKEVAVKSLVWDYEEENYHFKYVDEWDGRHDFAQYPVKLRVNLLRKSKNDDRQAYTAVHEAGHAVLAALTTRILPEKVVTRTADSTSHGFCQIRMPRDMMTKELLRKEIIISLGGYAAERLVFGEEETSTGVSGDIEDATELAIEAVKYYAMGKDPIHIRVAANDYNESFFHKPKYEKAALQLIREGLQSAEELLTRNKRLMLKMAAYLTEHARMDKATIGEFIKKYSVEPWVQTEPFIEPKEYFKFKDRVLQQLEEMEQENEGN
jgi:cell division protease FtsH